MNWEAKVPGTLNFCWKEFFVTTHDQALLRREFLLLPAATQAEYRQNIICLANRLQAIRDLLGAPISINSGWRSTRVNRLVGGVGNSYHLKGAAADIVVAGMTPNQVQTRLSGWSGGLGLNPGFTHLDLRKTQAKFTY